MTDYDYKEYRFYSTHFHFDASSKFYDEKKTSEALSKKVNGSVEKAMINAAQMVEETGAEIIGHSVDVKPFGVGTMAFVLIEVTIATENVPAPVSTDGLEKYEHQNLFLAQADEFIDGAVYEMYRGHRIASVYKEQEGGEVNYIADIIYIGGVWYVMSDELIEEITDEQT